MSIDELKKEFEEIRDPSAKRKNKRLAALEKKLDDEGKQLKHQIKDAEQKIVELPEDDNYLDNVTKLADDQKLLAEQQGTLADFTKQVYDYIVQQKMNNAAKQSRKSLFAKLNKDGTAELKNGRAKSARPASMAKQVKSKVQEKVIISASLETPAAKNNETDKVKNDIDVLKIQRDIDDIERKIDFRIVMIKKDKNAETKPAFNSHLTYKLEFDSYANEVQDKIKFLNENGNLNDRAHKDLLVQLKALNKRLEGLLEDKIVQKLDAKGGAVPTQAEAEIVSKDEAKVSHDKAAYTTKEKAVSAAKVVGSALLGLAGVGAIFTVAGVLAAPFMIAGSIYLLSKSTDDIKEKFGDATPKSVNAMGELMRGLKERKPVEVINKITVNSAKEVNSWKKSATAKIGERIAKGRNESSHDANHIVDKNNKKL